MNDIISMLLFVLCVFVSSCSQFLLKYGADKCYYGLKAYLNVYVLAGYSIFLIVTFVVIILYRYIQLSTGALLESLAFIFTPLISTFLLKEKLSKQLLLGTSLIICGIAIYAIWGGI